MREQEEREDEIEDDDEEDEMEPPFILKLERNGDLKAKYGRK